MKKTKVIIPALGLLVLSTAASISGTVAWFSLNQSVSMNGMSVTTQVSSNLMIAAGTAGTGTAGEGAFSSSAVQTATGILEPVSTVNGADFFYTTNGKADGDAAADDYVAYDQAQFRTDYGVGTAVGWVDYVFELKAVNTDTSNAKYINLSKLDLIYTGASTDTQKAFRVAIFAQAGTVDGGVVTSYAALGSSARCIVAVNGATNQTANYAVSAAASAPTAISITATNALTSLEVAAGATAYYKVTQRLYIEGEDTTCTNSTFLALTDAWKVFTQYSLEANNTASKTVISKYQAKSVALSGDATLCYYDGVDLYKLDDVNGNAKLNNGTVLPNALLTADELTALNSAFSSSFTRG